MVVVVWPVDNSQKDDDDDDERSLLQVPVGE